MKWGVSFYEKPGVSITLFHVFVTFRISCQSICNCSVNLYTCINLRIKWRRIFFNFSSDDIFEKSFKRNKVCLESRGRSGIMPLNSSQRNFLSSHPFANFSTQNRIFQNSAQCFIGSKSQLYNFKLFQDLSRCVWTHFVITVMFCNKIVAFCNKKSNGFCNKLLQHFEIKLLWHF